LCSGLYNQSKHTSTVSLYKTHKQDTSFNLTNLKFIHYDRLGIADGVGTIEILQICSEMSEKMQIVKERDAIESRISLKAENI